MGKVASLKSKIQKVKVASGKSKFEKVKVTYLKSKSRCEVKPFLDNDKYSVTFLYFSNFALWDLRNGTIFTNSQNFTGQSKFENS